MADKVETTTPAVEETPVAEAPATTEAAEATNGKAAEAEATNGKAEEATNGDAAPAAEAEEKKEEEASSEAAPAENGDAKAEETTEKEAVKRKGDEAESDATAEKITKLKEAAAEVVAESTPSEPANEAEAIQPEPEAVA